MARRWSLPSCAIGAALLLSAAAAPAHGATFVAITSTNEVLTFDSAAPQSILSQNPITGTGDFAPAVEVAPDGTVYLVTHSGPGNLRLFTLDPATGVATPRGPATPQTVPVSNFGLDFDPVAGNLRLVTDNQNNLRLNPADGTVAMTDPNLGQAEISGIGFSSNFPGATSTTLFGTNERLDQLVRITPNDGTVTSVGPLGMDVPPGVAFDLATDDTAFLGARDGTGGTNLYTVNLSTGAATLVGEIGNDITIVGFGTQPGPRPQPPPTPGPPPGPAQPPPQPQTLGILTSPFDIARGAPQVHLFGGTGNNLLTIGQRALGNQFRGGVFVAAGDVNGDGVADIVTGADASPRGGGQVRVFDQSGGLIDSMLPFGRGFHGGVRVATGDVNGDGRADIITGAGPGGGPHVRVFNGADGKSIGRFTAYPRGFRGGVDVAAGDVNGDGRADIITGSGEGARGEVRVFDGRTLDRIDRFFAYDSSFRGGVYVAAGDVNGDGSVEILTGPGAGRNRPVRIFQGDGDPMGSFRPFGRRFTGGATVAAGDVDGDGRPEIVTGQARGRQVAVFDGTDRRHAAERRFSGLRTSRAASDVALIALR